MPEEPNGGTTPGADADATKTGGETETGKTVTNPDNKTKTDDQPIIDPKMPKTQAELDAMFERRLSRHKKETEAAAKLTETQRLEKERDDALSQVNQANARDAFITTSKLPYEKASRLYKIVKDEIDLDDKGKPTNIAAVLKDAKTDWPEFFPPAVKGKGDGGGGNGGGDDKTGGQGMDSFIRHGRRSHKTG